MIDQITKIVEDAEYTYYGIRSIHHTTKIPEIGTSLDNSYDWSDQAIDAAKEDFEDADDQMDALELDGVSATQIEENDISKSVRIFFKNCYPNGILVLLGSHRCSQGQDEGEILMQGNVVLTILN